MPQMFCDGESVYKKFLDDYIQHDRGFFIVAPSGAGKTHFVQNQEEPHWIDGDIIWTACGAHPQTAWWTQGYEVISEIDQKSDVITVEAKKLGLWIVGASNFWLRPDAIVIPEWEQHKEYIRIREETNYDGGAKSEDHEQVLGHRAWLKQHAQKHDTPIFDSIEKAIEHLTQA